MSIDVSSRDAIVRDLVTWLPAQTFGSLRVVRLGARMEEDHTGAEALFLDVTLPDPTGETWDLEETLQIRRAIRAWLDEHGFDLTVYMALEPESGPAT